MTLEKVKKLTPGDVVAFESSNHYVEELVSIEGDTTEWRLLHADRPAFNSKIITRCIGNYGWKYATFLGSHDQLSRGIR